MVFAQPGRACRTNTPGNSTKTGRKNGRLDGLRSCEGKEVAISSTCESSRGKSSNAWVD
jgi:hypothetical protein